MKTKRVAAMGLIALVAAVLIAFQPTNSITVTNTSAKDLGEVTLAGASGSMTVSVPANGSVNVQGDFTLSSVTLNGQTVTYPVVGAVRLESGAWIQITWPATNYVEFADRQEIY